MSKTRLKANPRKNIRRKRPFRDRHVRILIVCEGRKTERNYFSDLAGHYRLGDNVVKVVGLGQTPVPVVEEAKKCRRREAQKGESYDKVFCVFDCDEHTDFQRASTMAEASGINLVRSWPCFEFWFLLHLRYTRKPFARAGSNSPADECLRELKKHWPKHWPEYAKNLEGLFQLLWNSLDNAKRHAIKVAREAEQEEEPNPSTEVHKLVNCLQSLGSSGSK